MEKINQDNRIMTEHNSLRKGRKDTSLITSK